MRSLRVFAPCGLLILCGLVDWSHSYPALSSEGAVDSIARNVEDGNKYSGENAAFADARSGHKAAPPTKIDTFDKGRVQDQYAELTEKTRNTSENGQGYESLAGEGARGSQTVKNSQPSRRAQRGKAQFIGKVKTFFTTWPVKFWEKIKHWFSKLNFFKSDDQKGINPSKDNIFKSDDRKGPSPPKDDLSKYNGQRGSNPSDDNNQPQAMPVAKPQNPGSGTVVGSKVEKPAQAPLESMGGSKVNPSETKNPKNPSRNSRQAPTQQAQSYTNPQKGARATGPQKLPRKKSGPSDSSALPEYSNNLPLAIHQPHDTRMSLVQPNNQVASGQMPWGFGIDSGAAQMRLAELSKSHQAMGETMDAAFNHLARANTGKANKQSWRSDEANLKITPHGNDGSVTAHAELTSNQAEFEVDPKTGTKSMRLSKSTMRSSTQHGPGSFLNLQGPGGRGNTMAIPSHAFNNRDNLLKGAGVGQLTWGSKKPEKVYPALLN
ncbi:uncharacterized protein MELLADRAFT_63212 [Melampsora larici-populina 98AG31]|uniref:Secreted protein n=1 Tax=Melampsora larici-populina (strain 98AG31 / pathotype 3-4-7) TaxID=747676 RepID=F4RLU4_MELLP|nr:uncharacterized protein MELLADRAFT_63212 [Melampsora larici-populina 98AG31]EGG06602.1 hypothetical protein MELLADRAFT_63212 [Melampsora larici-populina 98AG31]